MPPASDQTQCILSYADRIETDLRNNILPFWKKNAINPAGSFYGAMTNDLRPKTSAERGSLLTSRIFWTFSSAYGTYRDKAYLDMANYACDDLMRLYRDKEYGGFFWSVDDQGQPLKMRKQVYGQAFAIYALATYYQATEETFALEEAVQLFELLESKTRDTVHGGYFEAFARDWSPIEDYRLSDGDLNTPKSQNTLLHVMEAYTALLEVWPDPRLQAAHRELVEIMLDKVLDASHPHLGLFFTEDWKCWNPGEISYGHDIEAAWLLEEAAKAQDDPELIERVHTTALAIANSVLTEGIDTDGAIFYAGHLKTGVTNASKEWWPQVEAIMGYLTARKISGDDRFLETAFRLWDFCENHLIDRQYGGWIRATDRACQPIAGEDKISFWKCPYHNGRCGLRAPRLLREIAQKQ